MNSAELRELRNQLQAHAQRARIWIGNNPTAPTGAALDSFAHWADRAAAALERLEALEALRTRLQVFLATVGASTPDDHPWVVEARALANALRPCELDIPAPAPQQGGTDD